jgi:hypothetical protein
MGKLYVLTCGHVANEYSTPDLGISRGSNTDAAKLETWRVVGGDVLDVALIEADPGVLAEGNRTSLDERRLADRFDPVSKEFFLIHGFPGFEGIPKLESKFSSSIAALRVTPMTVFGPKHELPSFFDPDWYFAIRYSHAELAQIVGEGHGIATPHGISGAPVWNSRLLEVGNDKWQPSDARIAGIQCRWLQEKKAMICLRIEPVREFIRRGLKLIDCAKRVIPEV